MVGQESNWKERHSVTCGLCGGLADECVAVDISEEQADVMNALAVENPARFVALRRLFEADKGPTVHESCFEEFRDSDEMLPEKFDADKRNSRR